MAGLSLPATSAGAAFSPQELLSDLAELTGSSYVNGNVLFENGR
jgi:hypothetical protein